MRQVLCSILVLAVVPLVLYAEDKATGDLTDPLEILRKVDAAAKAVKAVKYDVVCEPTGAGNQQSPRIEGTYILAGWNEKEKGPERFLVEVKGTRGTVQLLDHTAGTDGKEYFSIDHRDGLATVGPNSKAFGAAARNFGLGFMGEFVHPEPFNDEITGKSRELVGSKVIGGEDCYEVHVEYQNAPEGYKAIWYFSKKDFLPRARHDTQPSRNGEIVGTLRTVTNLVVDPDLPDDTFRFKLPEGYKIKKTE
ncbi:MAG: hypothetical protein KJ749_04085 [Planctomycetes bacterium]|nr:hypothetical protein [Planctomycetota bacterium]